MSDSQIKRTRVLSGLLLPVLCWALACGQKTAAVPASASQAASPAQTQSETGTGTAQEPRATSTPYAGDLSIFEYPDRDKKLQIQRVMDILKIGPGSTVADLGAGSGWFTVRAARRVGPTGTVYAEDINTAYIDYIKDRAEKEKLKNVRTILGTPDDPMLPVGSVDVLFLLKVYHEIAKPVDLMDKVKAALKPGARVAIIDRNGSGTDHGLNEDVVVKEMGEAGFKKVGRYDFTKADGQDYFLVFEAK